MAGAANLAGSKEAAGIVPLRERDGRIEVLLGQIEVVDFLKSTS
jgi:hypothetical protein